MFQSLLCPQSSRSDSPSTWKATSATLDLWAKGGGRGGMETGKPLGWGNMDLGIRGQGKSGFGTRFEFS